MLGLCLFSNLRWAMQDEMPGREKLDMQLAEGSRRTKTAGKDPI